jgi:hypothetical protein
MADSLAQVVFTRDKLEMEKHMEKVLTRMLKEHITGNGGMIKGTVLEKSNSKKERKESTWDFF